ncbi:hypothetical protein GN958_ATG16949 [Phytophthora infestans]|uniref:Bzip transcription factor n=1 Tax=Phytophthora infestans TaxID=4787 RepID=A0A8S9U1K6_PHYIN|nr:hypothetical protein GN958_ATG16949 [Phytophthora infestans]
MRGHLEEPPASTSKSTVLPSPVAELIGMRSSSNIRTSDIKTVQCIIESIQMSDHSIPPDLQQVIVAEVLKTKNRYRERHRIYQARYRQRQSQAETKFKNAIIKLKLEIKDIQKKSKAPVRLATSPMSWELVSAYFWHLNNYVASPGTLYRNAFEFFHANVAPDVVDGSLFGIQAQIDNWRFLGYCFDDVRVELKGLKMLTSDILIAGTVTTVTFTAQTLRLMFPHLNSDGVGGRKGGVWSPLAAKTLFKKIVMSGSVTFTWHCTTDKVASIYTQADLITPILNLLGSLDQVSCFFGKAGVTPDCRFVKRY